jgi:hypothetical protein
VLAAGLDRGLLVGISESRVIAARHIRKSGDCGTGRPIVSVRAARHAVEVVASPGRRGFRAEIQVLRAVAVAGAVVYHLWPTVLPGGFVGVDVFFVISGFLITQQVADEAAASGEISR